MHATTMIFASLLKQKPGDRLGKISDLLHRARTIWDMSLVAKIDDGLFRHLAADRAQDGEPTYARVEDANG